jgi:hypothetical protein
MSLGWDDTKALAEMETIWHPEGVWATFVVNRPASRRDGKR